MSLGISDQRSTVAVRAERERGRLEVLEPAVAAVAGHAAINCYGVMGMAARNLRDGVFTLVRRENVHRGVEIRRLPEGLVVDLYVVVQYGTRIQEVAHNLQETVKFEIERAVQVPVIEVNVTVQGVHEDRANS
ncbi:MAG: Asp23/Gls24 family envelope stress response protein [Candidatus Dormibacteraeota bacterium]|nr:Asp23/Gls24 family envelope stress response protein [Candidatus Dormibacteraeota bacterium]